MVWRMIRYEIKRSLHFYVVWAVIAVISAVFARLHIFSLTDMPLFYLMLFGSIGIMIRRYYSSMHGAEAALLFMTDLSPRKQLLVRYCCALILSITTALMIGIVLLIQGEDMSIMLRSLSFPMGILLIAEVTISAFTLFIEISTALTLSGIRPFSGHQIISFVIFGAIIIGINSVLPAITKTILPAHFVVTTEGSVLISARNDIPASISFSLNTLIWNVIFAVIAAIGIPSVIRKKLLITK